MVKERWFKRKVINMAGEFPYGIIWFEGQCFEPMTNHGFIRPGHTVEVRRIAPGRVGVRRVNLDGTYGGEETWECG